jgi:hypothetical protein
MRTVKTQQPIKERAETMTVQRQHLEHIEAGRIIDGRLFDSVYIYYGAKNTA